MLRSNQAHVPQLLKPVRLEPVLHNKRSHCNEKPAHHNEDEVSYQKIDNVRLSHESLLSTFISKEGPTRQSKCTRHVFFTKRVWRQIFSWGTMTRFDLIVQKQKQWTSLVAQWLRIHLPMQGSQVRALVQEDPTCCGAAKPMHHNY
ncbi:hypothetical protein J1605_003996 [Eschrichtius robustus]|uniref:Uncharacterized protein n=1 Tax=Eschrichtius robustus TaxID=9764 RepID=A0AB34HM95_ESCRO|nr:hypothetical protein J1605_003996 [Eschrichtius robustus]